MISPRSYQIEAVESLYQYFSAQNGNPVLALPTGTGKSVIIAMFLQSIFYQFPGQRVMVLTHVKELIQQNYEKLMSLWPNAPAGIYSAGLNRKDFYRPITFGGIASVWRKPELFGHQALLLIDECHLVDPAAEGMYASFITGLRKTNPLLKVVGFTATPWRLGQGHITTDGIFTDVCYDITGVTAFNQLITDGYLAPLIPRRTQQQLDVNGVHMRGGEFIQSELQVAVDKNEVTYAALKETVEQAADRKHWLIFASGTEHCEHIVQMLDTFDIDAVAVHSKMSAGQRDKATESFVQGRKRALVNMNILTTGFDFPEIDCIVCLRPTASTVLWVQMLGRGTRPAPGKNDCLVLDFAGNTQRLGPINDPVIPRKKGEAKGEAPVRVCDVCSTYNHASARTCVCCGAEFSFQVKIKQVASTAELIKMDEPRIAVFAIDHVAYSRHSKIGKPPSVRVSYYCGLRVFHEFVLFEHEGFGRRKAQLWWKERSKTMTPMYVDDALVDLPGIATPTHLRVWTNKKPYPEILGYCYDGTAFGSTPAADSFSPPSSEVIGGASPLEEDDIPF